MAGLAVWETRAHSKRTALSALIPHEWRLAQIVSIEQYPNVVDWPKNVLSSEEIVMTETPPLDILANIHAAIWSAEQVVRAFCHRTAVAQQLTNCLTEILFDTAISTAQELDQFQQRTGRLKGPLHGLPVSYMDRFRIAGAETSSGFVAWLGPIESLEAEGPLVRHMRELGAIALCKTNIPQSMMLGNTTNNIFGSTLNPYNRRLSAGGAAGGEGALLAMKGSPFGWATEIAGSARIPATFNNIFALRVSSGRLPTSGIASSNPNVPLCNATIGMMSWDLRFLQHMCRLTLGSAAYQEDPAWLDMPWREARFQRHLRHKPVFGTLYGDGSVQPQPPLRRALNQISMQLRKQGFEVVNWQPPSHKEAVENLFRLIGADGAEDIRSNIISSAEPPVQQLRKWFFEQRDVPAMSVSAYWSLCKSRLDYVAAYHSYWLSSKARTNCQRPVDGIIMPVLAQVSCYENDLNYFGYSAIVNHLDFTSVAFPVTFVNRDQDQRDTARTMQNAEDAQIQTNYDPNAFHGMPVGLQVMCRRTEEETALVLAEVISRACRNMYDMGGT